MSSTSDQARGLILINGQAYPAKDVLSALERQAMTSLRVVGDELWIGNERVHSFPKPSAEQAMMLTCFGSLAYCCDLSRECTLRDSAIRLLRMKKEEYRAIQQECHQQFLRISERRWPHESFTSSSSQPSPSLGRSMTEFTTSRTPSSRWGEFSPSSTINQRHSDPASSRIESSPTVDLSGLFDKPRKEQNTDSSYYREPPRTFAQNHQESRSYTAPNWQHSSELASTIASASSSSSLGFCIYCGQDLKEGAEFCSRCGRSQH